MSGTTMAVGRADKGVVAYGFHSDTATAPTYRDADYEHALRGHSR
jgi:hypothetical protein